MKKVLSLALTLALVLGLCCPVLAIGPEPHILEEMAIRGRRQSYIENHPDEVADLTEDELDTYVDARLEVEDRLNWAGQHKEAYPQVWEAFDAQACLEKYYPGQSKADFMAENTILTEEEFADYLFGEYGLDGYILYDADADGDGVVDSYTEASIAAAAAGEGILIEPVVIYDPLPINEWWPDEDETPTLTLYVNGVASEVELTAQGGATYADADALRQILGPEVVSADQTGPIAIRPAAEAAGWDVGWYNGGWWGKRQEVQLWDKASFDGFLTEEFAPLNEFLAKAMEQSKDLLFSEKATAGHEAVTVDLKRFSTLDGDKDYKLTLAVDYIVQNGVIDMTFTFDLSQLLQLFDGNDLTAMTKAGGFTPTQLSSLLRAGKAELILDYNEGVVAYNVPLLALLDEDMAGWQSQYVPGLDMAKDSFEELGEAAFTSSLYAQMLTTAGYSGAEYAFEQYDQSVSLLSLFAGKDRFTTQNGKTTYSFTTEGVNAALTALVAQTVDMEAEELPEMSFFKACELTYTLDSGGNVTMEAHVRPDMEGIAAATAAVNGVDSYYTYGAATAMKWVLSFFDMDMTASARGNQSRATQRVEIHWNNVGKLSVNTTTTTQTTTKAPRQVEDVTDLPEMTPWQQLLKDMLERQGK